MTAHVLLDGEALKIKRLAAATGIRDGEPRIYVIEFSTGVVKVGRSGNAARRVQNHIHAARWHGIVANRAWVSSEHVNDRDNEAALIEFCRSRASGQTGMEYFEGVPFETAVAYAETLAFLRRTRDGLVGVAGLPPLMTFEEVSRSASGLRAAWMRRVAVGRFDHVRVGNTWLMTREQAAAFLALRGKRLKKPRHPQQDAA